MKVKSLSRVRLFETPWTVAYKAPLSMGFSRREYWRGLPLPSPGDLPIPGIEPGSPALNTPTGKNGFLFRCTRNCCHTSTDSVRLYSHANTAMFPSREAGWGSMKGMRAAMGLLRGSLHRARHSRMRLSYPSQTHQTRGQAGAVPRCLFAGITFWTSLPLLHMGTKEKGC